MYVDHKLTEHFPLALIALLSLTTTLAQNRVRSSSIEHTNAILISQYMIRTGDEALLITDPKEINELVKLFRNNRTVPHACAYHWNIWFRQSSTESIPFSHNEDCEIYENYDKRIHVLLNGYFKAILHNPTHFILNVKVPSSLEPEDAVRRLEANERKVFFFAGTEQRLPYVKLRAISVSQIPKDHAQTRTAELKNVSIAETKLRHAIEMLKGKYPVGKATKLDHRFSSFGGGRIEDGVETTVYFPFGTCLSNISVENEVEVLDRKTPTEYVLQLVIRDRFSEAVKRTLMSSNPFILDVLAFPNW
jgi:hypothetical protein